MFLIGVGAFTVSSLLCGLAPSAGTLLVARLVQGAAAALAVPQVMTGLHRLPALARKTSLAAYVAVLAWRCLPWGGRKASERLDVVGAALLAAGLILLTVPLILGRSTGWPAGMWLMLAASLPTLALIAAALEVARYFAFGAAFGDAGGAFTAVCAAMAIVTVGAAVFSSLAASASERAHGALELGAVQSTPTAP